MEEAELKLIIREQEKEWEYPIKEYPITVGRGPNNVIVLVDAKASRRHCVIEKTDEGIIIRDLGSRNGTTVNGNRIEVAPLKEGDIIGVGDTIIFFGRKKEVSQKAEFCLYVVRGEHEGKEFPLLDLPVTIGRKRGNKIVLSDERVSGEHAKVDIEQGRFVLVDLKSTNGTYIQGRRIEKEVLEVGTQFTISNTVFEFRKVGEAPPKREVPPEEKPAAAFEAEAPRPDTIREEEVELDMERVRRQAAVPMALVVVVALFVIGAGLFLIFQLLRAGGVTSLYKGGLIVTNPSFEEERDGQITGWATEPPNAAVRDPAISKQGKFSLHLSAAPNKDITILRYGDDIPVRQNAAYRLQFQVRTDHVEACALRVDWLSDTNPNFHKVEYGHLLKGTRREWTPLAYTFVAPPDASKMRVGLVLFGNRGECWVDEAKLTKQDTAPNRTIRGKRFSVWLSGHGTVDLFLGRLRLVQDIEAYLCRLDEKEVPPPDAYQSRAPVEEPTIEGDRAEVRGQLNCGATITADFLLSVTQTKEGFRLSYRFTKDLPEKSVFALRMLLPQARVDSLQAVSQGKKVDVPIKKTEWTGWGVTELIIKAGTNQMVLHFSLPLRVVMTQEGAYICLECGAKSEEMGSPSVLSVDVLPYSHEEKKGALELLEKIKALLEAERYQEAGELARRSLTNPLLTKQDKQWLQKVFSTCDMAGRHWIRTMEAMFEDLSSTPRAEIRDALTALAQKVMESYPKGDLKERATSLASRAKKAVKESHSKEREKAAEKLLEKARKARRNNLRGHSITILEELLARYPKTRAALEAENLMEDLRYERGR